MGQLTDQNNFDATVYQIETTDPVLGGPGGIANQATQNLANRTRWLYNAIAAMGQTLTNVGQSLLSYAPLASPALTGTPTAPTQPITDKSTHLATMEAVFNAVNGATYALDTGVAGALKIAMAPTVSALSDGMIFRVRAKVASPGAATLTVDANPAAPIWGKDHAPLTGGEIGANSDLLLQWNTGLNAAATPPGAFVLIANSGGYDKVVTPPQFDSSSKVATMTALQRGLGNLSNITAINSATVLTAAHAGQLISIYGAAGFQVTLPLGSTLGIGTVIEFFGNMTTGNIALIRQGTDLISVGSNTVTGITLYGGSSLRLAWNGSAWTATGESQLPYSPLFGAALGFSGYQKLPSGLILQWGAASFTSQNSDLVVTLPTTYPNNHLMVIVVSSYTVNSGGTAYYGATPTSKSQFTGRCGGPATNGAYFLSIGN